jgi:hypothetical protein
MNDLNCPHCCNRIPLGAQFCRGCRTEVHYGPPGGLILLAVFTAVFCGSIVGSTYEAQAAAWMVGLAMLAASYVWLTKVFRRDRRWPLGW